MSFLSILLFSFAAIFVIQIMGVFAAKAYHGQAISWWDFTVPGTILGILVWGGAALGGLL